MTSSRSVYPTSNQLADRAARVISPAVDAATQQVEDLARRSVQAVTDTSAHLRERATNAVDRSIQYVQEEPVKAVLIAAATGAALVTLASLIRSARRNG